MAGTYIAIALIIGFWITAATQGLRIAFGSLIFATLFIALPELLFFHWLEKDDEKNESKNKELDIQVERDEGDGEG